MSDNTPRKLNKEELFIYQKAVIEAVNMVPSFRDAIALMHPFFDPTAQTAYTDKYARMGLSSWFFNDLNKYQQASTVLHECMHVLNNHFARQEDLGKGHPTVFNLSGDFEINCGIDKLKKSDLSFGVFPDKNGYNFPRFLSMEQYFKALNSDDSPICGTCGGDKNREDHNDDNNSENSPNSEKGSNNSENSSDNSSGIENKNGSSQRSHDDSQGSSAKEDSKNSPQSNSNGSSQPGMSKCPECGHDAVEKGNSYFGGKGSPCDNPTDERVSAADEAGIERASDAEQSIAKANTHARIVEELKKTHHAGSGSSDDFLSFNLKFMKPPKVSWKNILRSAVLKNKDAISRGRSDYSYRKPNRRTNEQEYIFPGMIKYEPSILFGIDTSGSMAQSDYQALMSEAEGVIKTVARQKDSVKVFSVDATVKKINPVSKISDIKFQGGGGTDMSVAMKYVNNLPQKEKPDLFILATDAGTDWNKYLKELQNSKVRNIILVTSSMGMQLVPDSIKQYAKVIDISDS